MALIRLPITLNIHDKIITLFLHIVRGQTPYFHVLSPVYPSGHGTEESPSTHYTGGQDSYLSFHFYWNCKSELLGLCTVPIFCKVNMGYSI